MTLDKQIRIKKAKYVSESSKESIKPLKMLILAATKISK